MAQVDYFLKIPEAPGESPDSKHSGEIEVIDFSFGIQQSGTSAFGGGAGAGKANFNDFHFTKRYDKASPKLMQICATGEHIKSATLTCRKAGKTQQEFLKWKFTDLLISGYQTGGSGGSDVLPMDQVSFNFTKIEVSYAPQKADGSLDAAIPAGYDLKAGQKV